MSPGMLPPGSLWVRLIESLAARFPRSAALRWLVSDE